MARKKRRTDSRAFCKVKFIGLKINYPWGIAELSIVHLFLLWVVEWRMVTFTRVGKQKRLGQ